MSNLIIYYSRKGENYVNGKIRKLVVGNSYICADLLRRHFGGDLFEIVPEKDYPADYMKCTEVAKAELNEGARPALKNYLDDISGYDNVFICGPCWWGTYPCPVFTQLERLDFTGKNVFVLVTHEGSGLGHTVEDVEASCRGAKIVDSIAVHGAEAAASQYPLRAWAAAHLEA